MMSPRFPRFDRNSRAFVKTQEVIKKTSETVHETKKFVKKRKAFFHFWITKLVLGGISLAILGAGILFLWIAFQPIPSITSFEQRKIANSTSIYDNTGKVVLYGIGDNIDRKIVTSDQISPLIKNAFIAIEDKNFYQHKGIVLHSTLRGIIFTVFSKFGFPISGSGGSTITQQVVKNTLLTSDQRYSRKFKEWFLALKLEKKYTKEEILTLYINEVPFGGNMYGIETASNAFFAKPATDVTLAEAAYLASIPNAPTLFSPYGKNKDKLDARKNLVLFRMKEQGLITPAEYDTATKEVVVFQEKKTTQAKALHFVEYVRKQLEEEFGTEAIESQGYQVITTLDWRLQETAEQSVAKHALENEKAWNSENQALVAIDPKTGGVLSMVGSRGYEDPEIDGKFNVALALRQPGSSFKPFIYATAFEQGYTDQTVVFDVPIQFSTTCVPTNFSTTSNGSCYSPDNYDNKYVGPISLRNALAQSRNVPAVQMMYLVGTENAVRMARTLGVNSLGDARKYGLTLVLGGGEASLLNMTSAYGVLANNGQRVQTHVIQKILDKDGKVIFEQKYIPEQVVSADAAARVSSVLSDNTARTPLFGSRSLLYFGEGRPVAAKTGTTNNNKDAWLIGYTPDVVVGVWSGNNDNTAMKKGSIISAPTWREVMDKAIGLYGFTPPPEPLPISSNISPVLRGAWWGNESVAIDSVSGKLATEFTPPETRTEIVTPNAHSILHWVTRGNPKLVPADPTSDPQYSRWESGTQSWLANNPGKIPAAQPLPTDYDDVHGPQFAPTITITSAVKTPNGQGGASVTVEYVAQDIDLKKIQLWVAGNLLGEFSPVTQSITVDIPESIAAGANSVRLVAVDSVFNKGIAEHEL